MKGTGPEKDVKEGAWLEKNFARFVGLWAGAPAYVGALFS
jgi:hypothetical protein